MLKRTLQALNVPRENESFIIKQCAIIDDSYKKWMGASLAPSHLSPEEKASFFLTAPFILLSSTPEKDPILNFGNQAALRLWELSWDRLTKLPGRQTAEFSEQKERDQFLKTVRERGFIDDYEGIRISGTGKRFKIKRAVVWNLVDSTGLFLGQAATFSEWEPLSG